MEETNTETVVEDTTSEIVETTDEVTENVADIDASFLDTFDLDDLLNADFADDEIMSTTHRGLPSYSEVLKHLPENGRKLISNLRAMTTRKNQEIAEVRKQLNAERADIERQRQALYSGQFAENIESLSKDPEHPHDIFTDEGINAKIKQEAAKMFKEMIQPMQEELYVSKRQAELDTFKSEHPDLMDSDVKIGVAKLLKTRDNLSLEDAYYIYTAKSGRAAANARAEAERVAKNEKRNAWSKTSSGKNVGATGTPKFKDAWTAFQWHRDNGTK